MRMLAIGLVSLTILTMVTGADAFAQTTEGSIRGYVRDEQSGALPGVTVTATSPSSPRPQGAASDAAAVFRLLTLPPVASTVSAELQGFTKFVRPNVVVHAGLNLSVDVTMKIGAL